MLFCKHSYCDVSRSFAVVMSCVVVTAVTVFEVVTSGMLDSKWNGLVDCYVKKLCGVLSYLPRDGWSRRVKRGFTCITWISHR